MVGIKRLYSLFFCIFIIVPHAFSQTTVKEYHVQEQDSLRYLVFGKNKKIPDAVKAQVLTALSHYPELTGTRIIFRLKKTKTPLSSRPRVFSVLKSKKNRTYVITISTKSNKRLDPILFSNLPYNAQIGVLGHELGHVVTYSDMSSIELAKLPFKMLNKKFTDTFEFHTDLISIEHGLGYQLYDWSSYVRKALDISIWCGASLPITSDENVSSSQRYMNPQTILQYMESIPMYNSSK